MAKVLLVTGAMQDQPTQQTKPDRDLDEVLLSLEVELFGPPKKSRDRDDETIVIRPGSRPK